jgi:hypothetical protein
MAEREYRSQIAQIGIETTEGTAVAATKRLLNQSLMLQVNLEEQKYKPAGYRRGTRFDPGKKFATISGPGKPSYTAFPYIFDALYKRVTPTTPGGTAPRDWTYEQSSTANESIATFTLEVGGDEGMERSTGCFFSGWSMTGGPSEINVDVEGFGRAVQDSVNDAIFMSTREIQTVDLSGDADPTGGTWTLTILGSTITAIAWDVSAAALQTLINALFATGAADVTVTKAGFVYTINFPYYLGNVTAVTANGAGLTSGGSITITIATPQAGVAATEVTDRPIIPKHVSWYADTTSGGLGGTQLTRVLGYSIKESSMRDLLFTVNQSLDGGAAAKVDGDEPILEITLSVEADTAGMAFYQYAKVGTTVFLRFQALDAVDSIESSYRYQATFDFAAKVKTVGAFDNDQGVVKIDFTFEAVHDSGWGKAFSFVLRNNLTAL